MESKKQITDVASFRAHLREHRNLSRVDIRGLALVGENLSGIHMSGSSISDCIISNVNFKGADLHEIDIRNCEIRETFFNHCTINKSEISYSKFTECRFTEAKMRSLFAKNTSWHYCDMVGVRMDYSMLNDCSVMYTDFRYATMQYSNLVDSKFHAVNMSNSNLRGASISSTEFSNIKISGDTVFPIGFGSDKTGTKIVRAVDEHLNIHPPKSPKFKKWFGSSVVTRGGKPLVVYHGTFKGGFSKFSHENIDEHHPGFFFTDDITLASTYSDVFYLVPDPAMTGSRAGNYRVYLRSENPYVIDAKGSTWDEVSDKRFGSGEISEVAHKVREAGYDALIVKNVRDSGDPRTYDEPATVYVVFDPRQIKSATANRGTFSLTDPDITKNPRRRTSRGTRRKTSR